MASARTHPASVIIFIVLLVVVVFVSRPPCQIGQPGRFIPLSKVRHHTMPGNGANTPTPCPPLGTEAGSGNRCRLISCGDVPRWPMEKRRRRQITGRRRPKAATTDILAGATATPPIKTKGRRHYERLGKLLESIRQRQRDLNRDALDAPPNFSTHMAD